MTYVDVIVPLAFGDTLTYILPEPLLQKVEAGMRVVVPLGKRKYYTGIVTRIHHNPPPEGILLKQIGEVEDTRPILLPRQLELWQWMAQYYMCSAGEVMKAAMPSGLKLESESVVEAEETFEATDTLTDREREALSLILAPGGCSVEALQKQLDIKNALPLVRRLMDKGAVRLGETMSRAFRPRTELHVRLAPEWATESRLHQALDELQRASKQQALLTAYLQLSGLPAALTMQQPDLVAEVAKADLMQHCAGGEAALTALRSKGILQTYAFEVGRLPRRQALPQSLQSPLSEAQQQAFDEILNVFGQKDICLLHGVTSSGKTEIYTKLIQRCLSRGEQVLYLLPEIALTTQIMQRMARVFGEQMGVYHSKFPDAERVEIWQKQLSDQPYGLILGVRSSLFLPFRRLGLIIVDEEHETSYKQQDPAPRYNARDVATVAARLYGAKVLLGTATPSIESYHNALTGKYGLVRLTQRYGHIQLPSIEVEDVKELRRKKLMNTPFSPRLIEEMQQALKEGEQVILFQNRRGYSPVIECHTCGWVPRCTCCDVSLTFHQREHRMVCHYCGASFEVPRRCPNCGDTDLRDLGYGTEKIEAAVRAILPKARTARMDLDTTRSRSSYDQIIGQFQRGQTDILIGTQMVTKGLDFDRVRVVGIINADQSLSRADFRAYERTFQMLSQVAGRAGRRQRRGLVVLQTRQPQLPVIRQIVQNDYEGLYHEQLNERQLFRYPPFTRLIGIYLKHRDERKVEAAAQALAAVLRPHFQQDLLGPDRPLVGRIQLLYIRHLLLKVEATASPQAVRRTLLAARQSLLSVEAYKSVNVYFDVDPM